MKLPIFDQDRKKELSSYGEAVRLSNELRFKPAHTIISSDTTRVDYPDRWGFNCETADIQDFKKWLNNKKIKKSQSLLMFVYRIISIRFPTEFTNEKRYIDKKFRKELDLIESESKNEMEWVGLVSYQNMVRLDNSLTNNKTKTVKLNNDKYKIIMK